MSRHLSTRNISSKSMHAFLSNLANRQTDKQMRTKTSTSSFVGGKWNHCNSLINDERLTAGSKCTLTAGSTATHIIRVANRSVDIYRSIFNIQFSSATTRNSVFAIARPIRFYHVYKWHRFTCSADAVVQGLGICFCGSLLTSHKSSHIWCWPTYQRHLMRRDIHTT